MVRRAIKTWLLTMLIRFLTLVSLFFIPRTEDERDVKNVIISMIFVFAVDSRSSSFGLDSFAKHLKTHLIREVYPQHSTHS